MKQVVDKERFDPDVVQQLGRIDLMARLISSGVEEGMHHARRHGFSAEFSDYKPYVPGDDVRFLDWRLYARTDRLYVKRFEADTNLETLLLLDASKSMAWRWGGGISKLEYAANMLGAVACLGIRQHDQIGFVVHDARSLRFLPPRCRRTQLLEIFALLGSVDPGGAGTFPHLVRSIASLKRHRGLVVLCSDLEEDEEDTRKSLHLLSGTEDDIILFHILDRAEEDLPFDRATHIEDSETSQRVAVNIAGLRKSHAETVRRFRASWSELCFTWRIRYVPVHTGMNYLDVFAALTER